MRRALACGAALALAACFDFKRDLALCEDAGPCRPGAGGGGVGGVAGGGGLAGGAGGGAGGGAPSSLPITSRMATT